MGLRYNRPDGPSQFLVVIASRVAWVGSFGIQIKDVRGDGGKALIKMVGGFYHQPMALLWRDT